MIASVVAPALATIGSYQQKSKMKHLSQNCDQRLSYDIPESEREALPDAIHLSIAHHRVNKITLFAQVANEVFFLIFVLEKSLEDQTFYDIPRE